MTGRGKGSLKFRQMWGVNPYNIPILSVAPFVNLSFPLCSSLPSSPNGTHICWTFATLEKNPVHKHEENRAPGPRKRERGTYCSFI